MSDFWTQVEGEAIGDRYRLSSYVASTGDGAMYTSENGEQIEVRRADSLDADTVLRRWLNTSRLSHPNLVRLFDAGRCEVAGAPVIYAVMEKPDESLAGVLADRALSTEETRDMLVPTADALRYLHENGFVHGSIQPSCIFAIGDTLKLSSANLQRAGETPQPHEVRGYDAPELARGVFSAAGDVWSLGVTTVQALTQRLPADQDAWRTLPDPFGDIVRHCLKEEPEERWTPARISARLQGDPAENRQAVETPRTLPLPPAHVEARVPDAPPPARAWRKWPYAAAAAALAAIVIWLFARKPDQRPVAPVPAVATRATPEPAATPVVPQAPAPKEHAKIPAAPNRTSTPNGSSKRASNRRSGAWYVVVATYNQRSGAEKRAQEISRKWPHFKASVFEPQGGKSQHLVVIGSDLSEDSAEALKNRARAAGLPRDVFIARFPG